MLLKIDSTVSKMTIFKETSFQQDHKSQVHLVYYLSKFLELGLKMHVNSC